MLETAPMLQRLAARFALSETKQRFLGPLAADEMLARHDDPAATHALRAPRSAMAWRCCPAATLAPALACVPTGCRRSGSLAL